MTDVVISHHHPDHTVNIALFPRARVHDHWAVYDGDLWTSRDADGVQLSPSVRLLRTPGHTLEDISTLVGTADGVLAFTHAWWQPDGPVDDPYAPDAEVLMRSRQLLLTAADTIVPGHGPAFPAADAPPLGLRRRRDVHHPADAEPVHAHAELVAPHLLLQRHRHGATVGQLLPVAAQRVPVVTAEADGDVGAGVVRPSRPGCRRP